MEAHAPATTCCLSRRPVFQVRHCRARGHVDEIEVQGANIVQRPFAAAYRYRRDVQHQLLQQAGPEILPHRASATGDLHVAGIGRLARLFQCGLQCRR